MTDIDPAVDLSSLTGGANQGLAGMLGLLGGGGGLNALQSQLGVLASANPQLAPLLQMLQQRSAPPAPPEEDPPHEPSAPGIEASDVRQLMAHTEALEMEVEAMRVRNDALAAALGACHMCFGEDRGCEVCRGAGLPAWRPPEPNAFRRFVMPALRRVRDAQHDTAATRRSASAPRRSYADSLSDTEGPLSWRDANMRAPRRI
jgi:hypothetical protein